MISLVQEAPSDQRNGIVDCYAAGCSPKEVIVKPGKEKYIKLRNLECDKA